jgi:hypothetical protein
MKIPPFLRIYIREFLLGLKALLLRGDAGVLLHGFRRDTPYWNERTDRERAAYAQANPWVLKYDLGHRECIDRLHNRVYNPPIV